MAGHGILGKRNPRSLGRHKHVRRNRHYRSRSSDASIAAAGSIFTSLNMSIFTFHNHLLRCFSRFLCLATTASSSSSHLSITQKRLEHHHHQPPLLRKRSNDFKRMIILDLDETLVHSTMEKPIHVNVDFIIRIKIEGVIKPMYVTKRPGVTEFLKRISKNYRVAVFTAGLPEYASKVLDKLDKHRVITKRLYRDSCREINGRYLKDLSLVSGNDDLGSVLIVDDNPFSYSLQEDNGVHIKPFVDDMEDQELKKLADFFDLCYHYEDLRDAVTQLLSNQMI